MREIKQLRFYPNGHVSASSEKGYTETMPEIKTSWISLYLKYLEELGYDVAKIPDIKAMGGHLCRITQYKTEDGSWGYDIDDVSNHDKPI